MAMQVAQEFGARHFGQLRRPARRQALHFMELHRHRHPRIMGAERPQWTAAIKAAGVDSRKKPEGRAGSPRLVETVDEASREAVHYFGGIGFATALPPK